MNINDVMKELELIQKTNPNAIIYVYNNDTGKRHELQTVELLPEGNVDLDFDDEDA